jgi:hypothetical protein
MKLSIVLKLALVLVSISASAQKITINNTIPRALSSESNQNSEPSIAINPSKPNEIVVSAFTLGWQFCDPDSAPILGSEDGGRTWHLSCVLPSQASTADISLGFGADGKLYAAIIERPDLSLAILESDTPSGDDAMSVLVKRAAPDRDHIIDQPFIYVSADPQKALYVGENDWRNWDGSTNTQTASVDQESDREVVPSSFAQGPVEARRPVFDAPSVRPAVSKDGTAYVGFMSVTNWDQAKGIFTADVVVARKDPGKSSFNGLTGADSTAGVKVVVGRSVPWGCCIGQQRFGSHLSVAVDPNDSKHILVAWADRMGTDDYTLHVRESGDAGVSWSPTDLWTVPNAVNPALAINDSAIICFLYQKLTSQGATQFWSTELVSNKTKTPLALERGPADRPKVEQWQPYLGDYIQLLALGNDFYGVFAADNTPDPDHFPLGMPTYDRNVDLTKHALLSADGKSEVQPSIDPFMFRVAF